MSKDRQQRRDQQASVTSEPTARDVTQGPVPTTSSEVRHCERPGCQSLGMQSAKEGALLCAAHDGLAPAEIIEPDIEPPPDRVAIIAGLPPVPPLVACPACVGQGKVPKPQADRMQIESTKPPARTPAEDPFFIRRETFAGPPRKITIDVEVNGTEDPERLSQTILRQVHAQLLMTQDQPTRPPAKIPKAVHHLRKSANALPGDALRPVLEKYLAWIIERAHSLTDVMVPRLSVDSLADIAAALDLDVHAAGAAKEVRAALEALG